MKKLLIALVGALSVTSAVAGSTTATLTVNGTLASTCSINFTAGTSTVTALVSGASSTGSAVFNINCTPGISTLTLGAVSPNSWKIKGGSDGTDVITYTLTATSPPTGFASVWSGSSTTSVPIVTVTTQPVFTGTSIAIPLVIATQNVPATNNTGTYTDTITLTANF